jgi:hypothetical protein
MINLPEHYFTPSELREYAREHLTEEQFTNFYSLLFNVWTDGINLVDRQTLNDLFHTAQL